MDPRPRVSLARSAPTSGGERRPLLSRPAPKTTNGPTGSAKGRSRGRQSGRARAREGSPPELRSPEAVPTLTGRGRPPRRSLTSAGALAAVVPPRVTAGGRAGVSIRAPPLGALPSVPTSDPCVGPGFPTRGRESEEPRVLT